MHSSTYTEEQLLCTMASSPRVELRSFSSPRLPMSFLPGYRSFSMYLVSAPTYPGFGLFNSCSRSLLGTAELLSGFKGHHKLTRTRGIFGGLFLLSRVVLVLAACQFWWTTRVPKYKVRGCCERTTGALELESEAFAFLCIRLSLSPFRFYFGESGGLGAASYRVTFSYSLSFPIGFAVSRVLYVYFLPAFFLPFPFPVALSVLSLVPNFLVLCLFPVFSFITVSHYRFLSIVCKMASPLPWAHSDNTLWCCRSSGVRCRALQTRHISSQTNFEYLVK